MSGTELKILKYLVNKFGEVIPCNELVKLFNIEFGDLRKILLEMQTNGYVLLHGFDYNPKATYKGKDYINDTRIKFWKDILEKFIFSFILPIAVAFITAYLVSTYVDEGNNESTNNTTQNTNSTP